MYVWRLCALLDCWFLWPPSRTCGQNGWPLTPVPGHLLLLLLLCHPHHHILLLMSVDRTTCSTSLALVECEGSFVGQMETDLGVHDMDVRLPVEWLDAATNMRCRPYASRVGRDGTLRSGKSACLAITMLDGVVLRSVQGGRGSGGGDAHVRVLQRRRALHGPRHGPEPTKAVKQAFTVWQVCFSVRSWGVIGMTPRQP